ncbi:MAG: hypothetical protein Pg6C_19170 [Treponemataceae bacterium]|nr:MAG: hypothetical protein Pg6C_19170 [Treponemataceae bacterium]
MTFFEFNRKFPAEEAAIDYFYQARYYNILTCPHCGKTAKLYRMPVRRSVSAILVKTRSRRLPIPYSENQKRICGCGSTPYT